MVKVSFGTNIKLWEKETLKCGSWKYQTMGNRNITTKTVWGEALKQMKFELRELQRITLVVSCQKSENGKKRG